MSAKVLKKISEVMGKIQFLKKDGKVAFGKTNYKYLSESKITENVRQACLEVGLVIIPSKAEQLESAVSTMAKIKITYSIYDIESGENVNAEIIGYGQDSGDKSVYKALSGAYKYMQRQVFAIPTNENDPDKVSSEEMGELLQKEHDKQAEELDKVLEKKEETKTKKPLTVAQKVHILAKKKGKTENMRDFIKDKYGLESLNDCTPQQLQNVTQVLRKYPDIPDTKEG